VLDDGVPASGRAAQHRTHAGQHLVEIEWLDDVVIRAGIEACNPLLNLIARREDDDGRGAAALAHGTQDVETVALREPEIQNHQIENRILQGRIRALPIGDPIDGIVTLPQGSLQPLRNHSVVFNEQHAQVSVPEVQGRRSYVLALRRCKPTAARAPKRTAAKKYLTGAHGVGGWEA
jgi:hypothetical protein